MGQHLDRRPLGEQHQTIALAHHHTHAAAVGIKRQLPQAGTLLLQAVWREVVGQGRQQQGCFGGVPNRPHRTLTSLQVGVGAEAGAL